MPKQKPQVFDVKDFEGKFPAAILNSEAAHPDPAADWPGAPPNFGRDLVPHIYTVSGWVGSQARAYPLEDEALRASIDNAERMRKDPDIKECLLARQRAVALLPWSLIPEDEQDPKQKQLCTDLTTILERSRRFTEMRRFLMEAIWYGKSFVQLKYGLDWVAGQQRKIIKEWEPRHADKIVFRYSDGTANYQAGQVGIRVHAGYKHIAKEQIEPTQYGLAYWLRDWQRRLCIVHKHEIEDGPYMDPWMSGRIHGVGIRDSIYWTWFACKNVEANLLEYLERTALGIEIWRYPSGNPEAEKKARTAAEERFNNGRSVIMVPVIPGEQADLFGVQHIEPSPAGADLLLTICQHFYAHKIKRLILGQTLSSEAAATGLGSGVADAHLATYADIVRYDAINLQETLTEDLVRTAKEENFPWARKVHVRMVLSTDDPEVQEKLGALQAAWNMGLKLRAEDLYQLVGARRPDEEDDELENPGIANGKIQVAMGMQQLQMGQQQMAMQQAQLQMAAQGGLPGAPGEAPPDQEAAQEVERKAAGEPGAEAVSPWAGFWDSLFAAARGQGVQPPVGPVDGQVTGPSPNGTPIQVDQGELSRIFDQQFEEAVERRNATAQELYDALVAAVEQQPDATDLRDRLRFLFVWTDAQGKSTTPYGDPWGALRGAFVGRAIADGIARRNGHTGPREALLAALQARFAGAPERYDQEHPTDIIAGTDHYTAEGEPDQYGLKDWAKGATVAAGMGLAALGGGCSGNSCSTTETPAASSGFTDDGGKSVQNRLKLARKHIDHMKKMQGYQPGAEARQAASEMQSGRIVQDYTEKAAPETDEPEDYALAATTVAGTGGSTAAGAPSRQPSRTAGLRNAGPATTGAAGIPKPSTTPARMAADEAPETKCDQYAAEEIKHPWEMTRDELADAIVAYDRPSLERARPLLAAMFPEYTADDDPWQIHRAITKGDELPRVPMVDFTSRHRNLVRQAIKDGKIASHPEYPELTAPERHTGPDAAQDRYAAEEWPEGIEINPASLSAEVLNRISRTMKAKGYDSRGAEDARRVIASMINRETGLLRHPDWIEAYQKATGGVKARKDKLEQRKAQQAKLTRVNWERLKQLGTTADYLEAGYLAPEGHMIDLSGRRDGYSGPPMRNLDHREAGGTPGMQELMSAGHIRHMPESNGLDMLVRPTDKQWGHIRNIAGRSGGEMVVDLQDGLGDFDERSGYYQDAPRRWSAQYPKGTRFERIQRDINSFYDGQDPPPPPEARYTERQAPDAILARYRAGEIGAEELEQYAIEASCG